MTTLRIDPTPEAVAARGSDLKQFAFDRTGNSIGLEERPPQVTFEDVFTRAVYDVAAQKADVTTKVNDLANGMQDDLHGTMIAVKEAEITTKLMGTVRNKLLEAFQELWRTSV